MIYGWFYITGTTLTLQTLYPFVEHATLMRVFKFGVPSPVTGSQPAVAFQLACGTYDARPPTLDLPVQPIDPPSTMSLKPV